MRGSHQIWRLLRNGSPRVVELKSGLGTPVFLIHGAGGDINGFQRIADQTQIDGPIFGIQACASDMRAEAGMTVEQIGSIYAHLIQKTTPSKSLFIAGYSCGAVLALEAARALIKNGKDVPLLIAIDGSPLASRSDVLQKLYNMVGWLHISLSKRANLPRVTIKVPYADLLRITRLTKKVKSIEHQSYIISLLISVCAYTPRKYSGRVLLLKCTEQSAASGRRLSAAWRSFAHDLTIAVIKGRHSDIAAGEGVVAAQCAHAIRQAVLEHAILQTRLGNENTGGRTKVADNVAPVLLTQE